MNIVEKIKLGLRNPKNFRNYYLHLLDLKNRPLRKRAQFVSAQIEPTTRCNLACKMCLHSFGKMEESDLTFSQFKDILDQLPFLSNLTLQGLGEPLLNSELFEMIKEAKMRKIRVGLTTNGTLLNKRNASKIIESGLDWMYISLDAAEKEKYEEIRRGASYENVINNVNNFIKMKGKSRPEAGFWSLVMDETVSEVPNIIDLAEDIKMQKIVFQGAVHAWGHNDFKNNIDKTKGDINKNTKELVDVIRNRVGMPAQAGKIEIEVNINSNHGQKCNWPWRALYVTCDGYVTPCCMQGSDPNIVNFGNLFEVPLKEIVNNVEYQNFRKKLNSNTSPDVCQDCPSYYKQQIIKI